MRLPMPPMPMNPSRGFCPLTSRPDVDDTGARLQRFSAQLGIHLARAINFTSEVLLAVVDHLLPAFGQGAGSGLLFRSGRLVELLRLRCSEDSAEQQRGHRRP